MVLGWSGQAEQAIEWGEKGLRLSPFDAWAFAAWHSIVLGQFKSGRFDAAAGAATRAIQANPAHSISYMLQAAALAWQQKSCWSTQRRSEDSSALVGLRNAGGWGSGVRAARDVATHRHQDLDQDLPNCRIRSSQPHPDWPKINSSNCRVSIFGLPSGGTSRGSQIRQELPAFPTEADPNQSRPRSLSRPRAAPARALRCLRCAPTPRRSGPPAPASGCGRAP